jgi:REP element-mobilizing transposase RayT
MPRGNRHFLPGQVWHITHRCHQQAFLLKFARDRQHYLRWLFDAKKRFGLCVLNYTVTSNHIHLLVRDTAPDVISQSIQLVAGRTGRDYNQRKARKGAYWEDRYHATAVEADEHLRRCLVYIDLNMVRAGVVKHPAEWAHGGYREIQAPPKRYAIIDLAVLSELSGCANVAQFQKAHREWVDDALRAGITGRDERWSQSLAVGSQAYLDKIKAALGGRATHRQIAQADGIHALREPVTSYTPQFEGRNSPPRPNNTHFWSDSFNATNA